MTRMRVLNRMLEVEAGDIPLPVLIGLLDDMNTVLRQAGFMKSQIESATHAEMENENIEAIDTAHWTVEKTSEGKTTDVDDIGISEALLERIVARESKRNRKVAPQAVRSIVATTLWTVMKAMNTPKWSKQGLRRLGIDMAEHSTEHPGRPRIQFKKKGD